MNKLIEKYKKIPIAAKAAMWFVVCSFLQRAVSLITTPIFTRVFSTYEYGEYSLYTSWSEIFSILITFKLYEAVFNKSLVSDERHKKEILSAYQALSAIVWLIGFIIFLCLNPIIDDITQLPFIFMVIMFGDIFFQNAIRFWTAYQRFNYKYKVLVIVTLTISILNPVVGLILIQYLNNKVLARLLGIIIASGSAGCILFAYNIRSLKFDELKKYWRYALLFNLPLIPHYLSQVLLNQSDRIMIGRLVDNSAVALYSLAYTIGMLTTMVTQSVNNAYVPWMYRKLRDKEIDDINRINTFLLILIASVILCVFFWAPEVILFLGGAKYVEATNVVYPVAASVFFIFVYTLYANVELFYEKRKYVSIGTICSAILNIVLNYIFIKLYGYVAAAYTTLFCYICYGVFHVFIANRILAKNNANVSLSKAFVFLIGGVLIAISIFGQLLIDHFWIRMILFFGILIVAVILRSKIIGLFKMMKAAK